MAFSLTQAKYCSEAKADSESPQKIESNAKEFTKLEQLNLKIEFSSLFLSKHIISTKIAERICDNFSDELREDSGPWGFGLFSGNASCNLSNVETTDANTSTQTDLTHNLWTLRIDLNQENQGKLILCRPTESKNEKCDSSVTIPTSKFIPEILMRREFVRLVAASILDQTPLRSKLTSKFKIINDTFKTEDNQSKQGRFALPPYSEKLIPTSVSVSSVNGAFKVKVQKISDARNSSEKNIWLVTQRRGGLGKLLAEIIANATNILGLEASKFSEMRAKASTIIGRNSRRYAKSEDSFLDRIENITELRGTLSFSSTSNNAFESNIETLFTEDVFTNLWLETHLLSGRSESKFALRNRELGSSTRIPATRTLLLGAVGTGIRWSSDSDHTIFLYPKLEFGSLKWTVENSQLSDFESKISTNFRANIAPEFGFTLGYESPENWPLQWRARAGGSALNSKYFSLYFVDGFCYFPSPIFLGSTLGQFFGYGAYQSFAINANQSSRNSISRAQLNLNEIFIGGGLRWIWQ